MIVSYDIDGVLAAQPPANTIKWGRMNGEQRRARKEFLNDWYASAERLIEPVENTFHAISARKAEDKIQQITRNWLDQNYPNRVISFHLLTTTRSVENVVKFKSEKMIDLGIQRHYEDNKKVLRGMRKILPPEIELYFWQKGMITPVIFTL